MKYAIFIDDGETTVMRLDNLDVIDIDLKDIDRLYELADQNATLAEIEAEVGESEIWQDRAYTDDMRNDVICPREDCGHAGRNHSPDGGCLVEQYGDYCSCPLAPIGPWTEDRWPLATAQRDGDRIWEDEDDEE